jgi:hypothetical protein
MTGSLSVFYLWDVDYVHPSYGRGLTTLSVITRRRRLGDAIEQAAQVVQSVPDEQGKTYPFPRHEVIAVRFAGTLRYFDEAV